MQVRTIAFYNRPFPCGGAETVTRNLAYFFHARGMRVLIYTSLLQEELLGKEDRKTFETRVLPDPIDEAREKNVEFLQKSLVEEQVDVLIVQCMQTFLCPTARNGSPHPVHFLPAQHPSMGDQRLETKKKLPDFESDLHAKARIRLSPQARISFHRQAQTALPETLLLAFVRRRSVRIPLSAIQRADSKSIARLCPPYGRGDRSGCFSRNSHPSPTPCCRLKSRQFVPKRRSSSSSADSRTATNGSTDCSESGSISNRNGPTGV